VNDTVALPDPNDGVAVTQSGANTCQEVFDVTARDTVAPPTTGFHAVVGSVNVGATRPGWFTVMVRVVAGLPTVEVNNTVALRAWVVGFGCAVTTALPLPVPLDGLTVNQELVAHVPRTSHSVFEDTATFSVPPATAGGAHVVADGVIVNATADPA